MDLNLLLTLHALLAEKHVTRAARRIHKSQPAVSHALAQLREIFADPLLVRHGTAMALTPRAQALRQPLEAALSRLDALLGSDMFDPGSTVRCFRVAMSDYAADLLLPVLMQQIRTQAPGIDVAISQGSREAMQAQLVDGEIDLALGVFPDIKGDVTVETLFDEHFICVADKRSLPGGAAPTLETWLSRPHVLVAMRPDAYSEIDTALAAQGRRRHIALVLPHWHTSATVLAGTDLILTVASRSLEHRSLDEGLMRFAPPCELPGFTFQQAWHQRHDTDPAHLWFRRVMRDCSRGTASAS